MVRTKADYCGAGRNHGFDTESPQILGGDQDLRVNSPDIRHIAREGAGARVHSIPATLTGGIPDITNDALRAILQTAHS